MAGMERAWLALASQSIIIFSSGPAEARVASAFSRSATCSVGSWEKKVSRMCPRANWGSAFTALRKLARPSSVCSISILFMPFSKKACACGDLAEMCMPVGASWANACTAQNANTAGSSMRSLLGPICCSFTAAAGSAGQVWLVAFQEISLLQRKLAVHFEHVDAAVDGVNVHQPYRSGNRFHRFQKFVFRAHHDDAAHVRGQQRLKFVGAHVVELLD